MAERNFPDVERYRVFVGNLQKNTIVSHIEEIFAGCKISDTHLVRNRETDEFRGYAYVEFKDKNSYDAALACDGLFVNEKQIRVNDAGRNDNRGGSGPRGRRGGNNFPRGSGGGGRDFGGQGRDFGGQGRDFGGQGRDFGGQGRDFGGQGRDFDGPGRAGMGGRQSNFGQGPMGRRTGGAGPPFGGPSGFGSDRSQTGGGYRPKVQQPFQAPNPPPPLDDKDRPRLSLQPRSKPLEPVADARELSERSRAIFGCGKPRVASPKRAESNHTDSN